jgi:hypothetical protein
VEERPEKGSQQGGRLPEQRIGKEAPLDEDEVVVLVPSGTKGKVIVEEMEPGAASSQITVRVSRNRRTGSIPVLGVIVK